MNTVRLGIVGLVWLSAACVLPVGAGSLEDALKAPDVASLETLLSSDPELATRANASGNTALHYAAALNRADAIKRLIAAGADPNARRVDGSTPLHVAAAMNASDAMVELLTDGAKPMSAANDGATPLVMAARKHAAGAGAVLLTRSQVAYLDASLDARTEMGRRCVQSGDMDALDSFLGQLLRDQPDEGVKFAYGLVKFSKKDYARAEMMFEDIVNHVNPANARAHMELAQTYVALERFDEARQTLRAMLRHDLPQETRQIINQSLAQLDNKGVGKRSNLAGRIDVGVINDSNVNVGPDSPTISIAPIIFGSESITSLAVDESSQPQDAQGSFMMATLSGLYDVGEWGGWAMTMDGSLYANQFSDYTDQETRYYQGSVGLRRVEGRSLVRVPVSLSHIDRGGDPLADVIGLSPSWTQVTSSSGGDSRSTTLGVESRNYKELNDRDSLYATLMESWQKELSAQQELQFSGAFIHESAESDIYSYEGASVSVRDDIAVYSSVVIYGAAKYTYTGYKEKEVLATSKREDQQIQLVAGVDWTFREHWGVDLNFVKTDNQSTFDLYQYTRDVLTLSAFYSF